jgi:hypothetical protein
MANLSQQIVPSIGNPKCWHCKKPHTSHDEFCTYCHGWVTPAQDPQGRIIDWKTVTIEKATSEAEKRQLMIQALNYMNNQENVAIFGHKEFKAPTMMMTDKRVVFICRASGRKMLSISSSNDFCDHASSQEWANITHSQWSEFTEVVGALEPTCENSKIPFPALN